MAENLEKDLKNWLVNAKKIVIVGIGNPIRKDDYVGLKIVENLKGKLPEKVLLLEAETVPEKLPFRYRGIFANARYFD